MVAADLHARVLKKLQAFFVECGTSRTLFARKAGLVSAVVSSRVFPKKDVQNVNWGKICWVFLLPGLQNGAC